ncbi:hypothetical protein EJ02DRAFT_425316 [Clathrospora elynae]|uniref:Uncharacterized protein n=1 Tax=Clathrospora elynae TaxID=706981 RepID=A0A6A5SGS9_9PLEO|nr:hypothetical protein EJ02DRAFT_425316 [Clathrospora elynae]
MPSSTLPVPFRLNLIISLDKILSSLLDDPSSGDAKAPSGSKEDQGEHVFPEVCAVASPVDQGENVTPPKQDPEHHQCNRNSCNYQITPSMGAFQHPYTAPIPAQPTLTPTNPQPLSELLEDTHFIGVENARECTSRWIDSSDYPEWVQNPDQIDHSPPEHTVRRVISQGFETSSHLPQTFLYSPSSIDTRRDSDRWPNWTSNPTPSARMSDYLPDSPGFYAEEEEEEE